MLLRNRVGRRCASCVSLFALATVLLTSVKGRELAQGYFTEEDGMVRPDGSCPLMVVLPFSDMRASEHSKDYAWGKWSPEALVRRALSYLGVVQMAVWDFNRRQSNVMEEENLEELVGDCDVSFPWYSDNDLDDLYADTSVVVDSTLLSVGALRELTKAYVSHDEIVFHPCAIVGPSDGRASESIGTFAAARDIPMAVFRTTHSKLSNWNLFPSVIRSGVDMDAMGAAYVSYLLQRPGFERPYVAVIQTENTFGTGVFNAISREGSKHDLKFRRFTLRPNVSAEAQLRQEMLKEMKEVKANGFHTMILLAETTHLLPFIADAAQGAGLVGEEYFWLLDDMLLPPEYLDSDFWQGIPALETLLHGAGVLRVVDEYQLAHDEEASPFFTAWRSQNKSAVAGLHALHPKKEQLVVAQDNFFLENDPPQGSTFLYDAVISIGLSWCNLRRQSDSNSTATSEPVEGETFPRNPLIADMVTHTFNGASGRVHYSEDSKGRRPTSVKFGMYNIRRTDVSGTPSLIQVLTSVGTRKQTKRGQAAKMIWDESRSTFLYHSGSSEMPQPVHDEAANYLNPAIRIGGILLACVSIVISMALAVAIYLLRRRNFMKAAQPVFLYPICAGSAIMSVAIFTLSHDESNGWSNKGLSRACMATPCLFVIGYLVTYSAIFSKLWRIHRILQSRRRKVLPHHVLGPPLALMLATVTILTVWAVKDPFHWERVELTSFPLETYGKCSSAHTENYLVPLVAIMAFATGMAVFMAWQTRDVSEHLSESRVILQATFSQMQTWMVGVPLILVLSDESEEAIYAGRVLLIWTFALSTVLAIVGRKCLESFRQYQQSTRALGGQGRRRPTGGRNAGKVHISGVGGSDPQSSSIYRTNATLRHSHGTEENRTSSGRDSSTTATPPMNTVEEEPVHDELQSKV